MDGLETIEGVHLQWGESARWDDRRQRLYVVDCATQQLHWLDAAKPPLHSMQLPALPTGVVLTEERDLLVVCLDDGLHLVDVESETTKLLAAYPDQLGARANDANADTFGNLLTGTLNLSPGAGSLWRFSTDGGWTKLADEMGNVNGPAVIGADGTATLVCGDTLAGIVHAFDYDGSTASGRRTYADHRDVDGAPDGCAIDADGHLWSCSVGAGRLLRVARDGVDDVITLPANYPSDVAFVGPDLDRIVVTTIALDLGRGEPGPAAGSLLELGAGTCRGRPEPRFRL